MAVTIPLMIRTARFFRGSVGFQRGDRLGQDPSARLATKGETAPLIISQPHGARLLLGRDLATGHLLASECGWQETDETAVPKWALRARQGARGARGAVALVGVSQSGKTRAVQRAINEWAGPVIAVSVKSDLLGPTWHARNQAGEIKVFDPAGAVESLNRVPWSPLTGINNDTGVCSYGTARSVAADLAAVTNTGSRVSSASEFWTKKGTDFVASLLWYVAFTGGNMRDVLTLSRLPSFTTIIEDLDKIVCQPSNINAVSARNAMEFFTELDATEGEQRGSYTVDRIPDPVGVAEPDSGH